MIYITEGLQLSGRTVNFLTLTELFSIFDNCPSLGPTCPRMIMKNICLGKKRILKALPIHIEENDRPFLKRLEELKKILTRDVILKVNICLSYEEKQILKNTPCLIDIQKTEQNKIEENKATNIKAEGIKAESVINIRNKNNNKSIKITHKQISEAEGDQKNLSYCWLC